MKNRMLGRKIFAPFIILVLALSSLMAGIQTAAAATGTICDQYGNTTQGNYTVMNNRWGTTATQCINVTNNGFQIIQQDGQGNLSGAPASYPAIYLGCHYTECSPNSPLPMQISQINNAPSSTSVTLTSNGDVYDAAYDIWLNATTDVSTVQDTEIMIWLHHTGSIQPIGSQTGSVSIAGHSWSVWTGNNGSNNVVSYQSSGITSLSFDVKDFINDTLTRGSQYGNTSWYLTSVQMGFEPWIGGVGLAVNSFSASVNTGGGSTSTPFPTSGATPTRTNTPPSQPSATPTSGGSGSTCSPVNADISAPFSKDGSGSFCWRSNNLGGYVNSWNLASLTINGMNATNVYVGSGSYPAQIGGYWYVSYNSSVGWGHFEAAGTGGPTNTPAAATNTPVPTNTQPAANTPTRTNTPPSVPTNTPTRTNTPPAAPTATPTSGGGGGSCSPVNATISAPFTKDGSGTLCWQSSNLGSYVNSWNLSSLTINGVNFTNVYVGSGSYPAQIGGYWYVAYNGPYAWSHFEAK